MRTLTIWTAAVLAVIATFAACASDPPPPATPPQQTCPPPQVLVGGYCQMPADGGAGGQATTPPTTTGAPPSAAGGTAPVDQTAAGPAAQRIDAGAAAGAVGLLQPLVSQHVPAGAKPLGAPIAGQFAQGQSLTETITMQPGGCYTILAAGAPGVTEVDLALTPNIQIPGFNPTAAKDPETGSLATLGKQPNCFKWALPAAGTMQLVFTVPAGQGIAAAQVYEKL